MVPWAEAVGVQMTMQVITPMTKARIRRGVVRLRMGEASISTDDRYGSAPRE
jgi:hypothetical protein